MKNIIYNHINEFEFYEDLVKALVGLECYHLHSKKSKAIEDLKYQEGIKKRYTKETYGKPVRMFYWEKSIFKCCVYFQLYEILYD